MVGKYIDEVTPGLLRQIADFKEGMTKLCDNLGFDSKLMEIIIHDGYANKEEIRISLTLAILKNKSK